MTSVHKVLLLEDCTAVRCDGHGCGKILDPANDPVVFPNFLICEKCVLTGTPDFSKYGNFKLASAPHGHCYCDLCLRVLAYEDYMYIPDVDLCHGCYIIDNFTAPEGVANFMECYPGRYPGAGPLRGMSVDELVEYYDRSDDELISACAKGGFLAGAGGVGAVTSAHTMLASVAAGSGGVLLPITVPIHFALGVFGLVHADKQATKARRAAQLLTAVDRELSRRGFRVTSPSTKRRVKTYVKALAGCVGHHAREDKMAELAEGVWKTF